MGAMTNIISWIILGFLAGALAKLIKPGKQGGGFFKTTALGIGGALVGGFLGSKLLGQSYVANSFSLKAILFANIFSLILLAFFGWLQKKKA